MNVGPFVPEPRGVCRRTDSTLMKFSSRKQVSGRSRYLFAGGHKSVDRVVVAQPKPRTGETTFMQHTFCSEPRKELPPKKKLLSYTPPPDRLFKPTECSASKTRSKLRNFLNPLWNFSVQPQSEYIKSLNVESSTPKTIYPKYLTSFISVDASKRKKTLVAKVTTVPIALSDCAQIR